MSASFEESVIALKSMFPDLSEVVVRATLEARDGHMESAVEKLLAMSRRGSGNGSSAHGGGRNGGQEYGGARFGAPGAVGMSPSATGGRNGCVVVTSRYRDSMVERRAAARASVGLTARGRETVVKITCDRTVRSLRARKGVGGMNMDDLSSLGDRAGGRRRGGARSSGERSSDAAMMTDDGDVAMIQTRIR
jgi:hypothetical protein